MTTAFILALIAAGGVTVVLIFALNYIRSLERERQRLFKMIGKLNETVEKQKNKELPKMLFKVMTSEGLKTVEVKGKTAGDVKLCRDCICWGQLDDPEKTAELRRECYENVNADLVCSMWMSDGFGPFDYCSHWQPYEEINEAAKKGDRQ